MKKIITISTLLLTCAFSTFAGDKVKVTTADRGDGKPGLGADLWLNEKYPENHTGRTLSKTLMVRTNPKANNPGILRFDLSLIDTSKVSKCTLNIFFTGQNENTIKVYALKDLEGNEELFSERDINWNTFAGLKKVDNDYTSTHWDTKKIIDLGTFKNPKSTNQWVTFSSEKLTQLVKSDSNHAIVIMLQGGTNSSSYATKEGDTDKAPQLIFQKKITTKSI
jgi:hypothetical protein